MSRTERTSRPPTGRRIEVALDGARVAWVLLPAGAGVLEPSTQHHVAVHLGPPHRLWEARDGARRDGPHRRGHVVVTAAGERTAMRWDRPTVFVDVAFERALVEPPLVGAFARDAPELRDAIVALARAALGRRAEPLALEALVLAASERLAERGGARASEPRGGLAPVRLRRVLDRIHGALAERHSLVELAALAGTSRFHFARQFQRATGLPPHAYVIEARVNEAARLLSEGADVDDVALRVGMNGRGHLARHVTARLGVTPGELRSHRSAPRRAAPRLP